MDETSGIADRPAAAGVRQIDSMSAGFEGRWHRLVSTTNWEKGRIICQWREALIAAGEPTFDYSDETWSRRVGGVSGQHVGRLRRAFERFGDVYEQYAGLYWSHFQAALDWDDAEMWLEGAVQNGWSVAQMRATRAETLGALPEATRGDDGIGGDEDDEGLSGPIDDRPPTSGRSLVADEVGSPAVAMDEAVRREAAGVPDSSADDRCVSAEDDMTSAVQPVRPFARLADLPDDLAEAFEAFKLAILRHRAEGWLRISAADVLATLEALQELVRAPADASCPNRSCDPDRL